MDVCILHVSKGQTGHFPYVCVNYTSIKLVEKISKQICDTQAVKGGPQCGGRVVGTPLHRAGMKPEWVASRGGQTWGSALEVDLLFIPFHILNDEKHCKRGTVGSHRAPWARYQKARDSGNLFRFHRYGKCSYSYSNLG